MELTVVDAELALQQVQLLDAGMSVRRIIDARLEMTGMLTRSRCSSVARILHEIPGETSFQSGSVQLYCAVDIGVTPNSQAMLFATDPQRNVVGLSRSELAPRGCRCGVLQDNFRSNISVMSRNQLRQAHARGGNAVLGRIRRV
jgi:hypothetical protein